jgi:hypothetical protein
MLEPRCLIPRELVQVLHILGAQAVLQPCSWDVLEGRHEPKPLQNRILETILRAERQFRGRICLEGVTLLCLDRYGLCEVIVRPQLLAPSARLMSGEEAPQSLGALKFKARSRGRQFNSRVSGKQYAHRSFKVHHSSNFSLIGQDLTLML